MECTEASSSPNSDRGDLIGVEALYIRVDPSQRVAVPLTTAAGEPTGTFRSTGSEDTWEGRLRVQRDF